MREGLIMKSRTVASKAFADERRPVAIKKILLATDFSPASERAFSYATYFARQFGAEITLLHVIEPRISATLAGLPAEPEFLEREMSSAKQSLRSLLDSARAEGVRETRSTIRAGTATDQIVEAARDLNSDLIVIATHGFASWRHFSIDGTAERVARAAPCPVLVVCEKAHEFCDMKTICCAFSKHKRNGKCEGNVETVGFTKPVSRKAKRSHPKNGTGSVAKPRNVKIEQTISERLPPQGLMGSRTLTKRNRKLAVHAFPERRKTNKFRESHFNR